MMKRIFILVLLLAFVTSASWGQKLRTQQARAQSATRLFDVAQLLRDVETLSADDMQGRKVGTAGGARAREYVLKRFKQSGLKPFGGSYLQSFEVASDGEKLRGANVIGYLKGRKGSGRYIVVTAHYDHLGIRNNEIYNGADDNASGVSALFALAAYFQKHRPAHSMIFVAFDAEEAGLLGSKKFVAEPPVKKDAIAININLDMVSHNDRNELYLSGTYHYPFLKTYLERVRSKATVKLLFGHDSPDLPKGQDWTSESDHYPFHQAKIPFIYFGVEDHQDYHKPTDEFVNINRPFYVRAVETILAAVKAVDENLAKIEQQKRARV